MYKTLFYALSYRYVGKAFVNLKLYFNRNSLVQVKLIFAKSYFYVTPWHLSR